MGSIKVVKRLRLRHGWFERIISNICCGCRACSDRWYGKLIYRICEGRLVRVDMGVSWRGGVVKDGCDKS